MAEDDGEPGDFSAGRFGQVSSSELTVPSVIQLLDYWEEKAAIGRLPSRDDVDPIDLRFILGDLILVDVLRDPLRFRFRLMGVRMVERLGYDMTGKLLDEHPEEKFRAWAIELYTEVVTSAAPVAVASDALLDGRVRKFEAIMLPLASDGRTVDKVLVGQVWV
ncbi:MAG: PAS domain-containing protein [Thalassobaculaceae bacterium]|nr:PAS domain-containing protein [Thalassobaculaceae bacterium]